MIERLSNSSDRIVGFTLSGTLTDEDYQVLVPQLERRIKEVGALRLLMNFEDFHGWKPKAVWDDFTFAMKHTKDIERLAIVGDNAWEEWIAKLSKPFTKAEVKYYSTSQIEDAWEWLRGI
jgi:hypothetical protein